MSRIDCGEIARDNGPPIRRHPAKRWKQGLTAGPAVIRSRPGRARGPEANPGRQREGRMKKVIVWIGLIYFAGCVVALAVLATNNFWR